MGRLSQRLQPPSAYAAALRAGPGPYDARQSDTGPMQQSMAMPWEDAPIVDRMPPSAYAAALRAGPGPYDARQTDAGPMQQSMVPQRDLLAGFQSPNAHMEAQQFQWKSLAESLGLKYTLFDSNKDQIAYHEQLNAMAEERLLDQTPPAPPTNSTYAAGLRAGPGPYDARQTDAGPMQQSMAMGSQTPTNEQLVEEYFNSLPLENRGIYGTNPVWDNLAPFGKNAMGGYEVAWPGALSAFAESASVPGRLWQGEQMTPDQMQAAAFDLAGLGMSGSLIGAPAGALGSGPVRKGLGDLMPPGALGALGSGLTRVERARINDAVSKKMAPAVRSQIEAQKAQYLLKDGWAQPAMEVAKVTPAGEVVYREVPYAFDKPPAGVTQEAWTSTLVDRMVEEIRNLTARVAAGDPAAKEILANANWYRTMRTRLRTEFGGMGDVFADMLGTTSAQTGVEMNWNNAIEIMRRFSRGEYDEELRMYQEMLGAGDVNPNRLMQLHNDPDSPFRLITSAAGALFNTNSPAATKGLFDMFRVATGAPKTPNFTGNLIGYTNKATIDVWAARHLRRLAGLLRLPPVIEKGVTGKHRVGSSIEQPNISGEFGFGQRVFEDAARRVNEEGIIRNVAPHLQDVNPDDLQAVAWFIEKERWTQGGWTSKAGEGGSFEFEASLAGAADPAAVKALRREINQGFKPPARRANDTDTIYAAREGAARAAYDERRVQAQAELDSLKAPLARYVLGISVERPGARPSNSLQALVSGLLGEPAKADPGVVMYQVNNTYGRFRGADERAFNAEFVVRENFDPTPVTRRLVEVARDADQDSAFISKVVPLATPSSRPGVEIYFSNRQGPEFARELSDKLTEYGVDGFTYITDSRVMDRAGAQARINGESVAGITGLRFQYIPEFDIGKAVWLAMKPAERAARLEEVRRLYEGVANSIDRDGVSTVNFMEYETKVFERGEYDDYLK